MINLNTYIIEKLKINKDVLDHTLFSEGEKIIRVEISEKWNYVIFPFDNTARGTEGHYYIFKEIQNKKMYFKVPKNDWSINGKKDLDNYPKEKKLKENSKGYYETQESNNDKIHPWYLEVIYLNKKDSIDFIENVYLKHDVEKLRKYFDIEIKDNIEFRASDEECKTLLNSLNEKD